MSIDARLTDLGLTLPDAAAPAANYVPYVVSGNLIFISGQITIENGALKYLGKVGADIDVDTAKQAARLCGLNIIAQAKAACGGDLDKIKRIVRLGGFVNSTPEFTQQPEVINGCSDLMVEVFGPEVGSHARAAVSAGALPRNVSVEIEAVIEIANRCCSCCDCDCEGGKCDCACCKDENGKKTGCC